MDLNFRAEIAGNQLDRFLGHLQNGASERPRKEVGQGNDQDKTKKRGKKEGFPEKVKQVHLDGKKNKDKKDQEQHPFPSKM